MLTDIAPPDLAPPHERWPARAARDMERVRRALGAACQAVHHVGSTSVPGLHAAPVIDLVAELDRSMLSGSHLRLMAHGFAMHSDEAHCTLHVALDALTGTRKVELRCYPARHQEAQVIVSFFALIRTTPAAAAAYDGMKRDARARHGAASPDYHAVKRDWMQRHCGLPAWPVP